jgi:hypothetical protein
LVSVVCPTEVWHVLCFSWPHPQTKEALVRAAITITIPLAAIMVGGCAGEGNVCDSAWEHVTACGVGVPHPGECTPAKAKLAADVLANTCEKFMARSAFSNNDDCNNWSLFKPWCWFDDDESSSSWDNDYEEYYYNCQWEWAYVPPIFGEPRCYCTKSSGKKVWAENFNCDSGSYWSSNSSSSSSSSGSQPSCTKNLCESKSPVPGSSPPCYCDKYCKTNNDCCPGYDSVC